MSGSDGYLSIMDSKNFTPAEPRLPFCNVCSSGRCFSSYALISRQLGSGVLALGVVSPTAAASASPADSYHQ